MLTESWVEGKSVEEKDAQPTERTAALWRLSSKIDSRIWVNFTRNGLRLGSRHQEPPHTDVSRNLATVTWAKEKKNWTVAQGSKVLFSDESKFCISFGNQGPRVWRRVEKPVLRLHKTVLSFHSLWWFGVQCHLLVLVHCVFWKPTSLHCLPRNFGALHASFCWPAF